MSQVKFFVVLSLFSVLWAVVHSISVPSANLVDCNLINDFQTNSDLEFVHVIYRHGDRNPAKYAPGDKYDLSYWPEGWGQLTNLGKQQVYALGQWLRKRYDGFLSRTFNVDDIYVQSSDVDRTLMSALANLAGLYPAQGSQNWNSYIYWQPIPVHTMPATIDYLIGAEIPSTCTSYKNAYNRYLASAEMQAFYESLKPLYDYVSEQIGTTVNDLKTLLVIRDAWVCQSNHNLTIPEWARRLYPENEQMNNATVTYYKLFAATKFLAKFSSGFLLKDILDRFTSKTKNLLTPDRKMWMYSTHDTKVFNFLKSLDISNDFVPYAGAIMLELRRYQNTHYVQMFYKNSEETPKAIEIPGCGSVCPLSSMYEVYDSILPKFDFATECQIEDK